jgi:hypothetical protein
MKAGASREEASADRPRRGFIGRALPFVLVAAATVGCSRRTADDHRVIAQELVLTRQIEGLRALIAAAEKGSLVPNDKLVVAVSEQIVKDLAALALPREQVIADKFRVRLEKADVRFRDGAGSVRLDGRVSPAGQPADSVFAELAVFGLMDRIDLDPQTGVLRGKVSVIGFELKKVGVFGESRTGQRLLEELAAQRLDDLSALALPVEIPVHLEEQIALKGVTEGPVRLRPATFPVKVSVANVTAHGERLWVALDVSLGRTSDAGGASPSPSSANK